MIAPHFREFNDAFATGTLPRGPQRSCTTSDVRENLFPRPRVWYAPEYVSTIDHQVQHLTTTRARREHEGPSDAVGCALWSSMVWGRRTTQNPPGATPCEFDSRLGHW